MNTPLQLIKDIADKVVLKTETEDVKDNELYKILVKEVDAYIGNALRTSPIRTNKDNAKFLKTVEGENDQEWVFRCLSKTWDTPFYSSYKPIYIVHQYRGLRINDTKRTCDFAPSNPERLKDYGDFLKKYERVQGVGRYTLNSLLSDFATSKSAAEEFKKLIFVDCQFTDKTEFIFHEDKVTKYILLKLNLSHDLCKILIDDDSIIEKITNMPYEDKKTETEREIEKIFQINRNHALYSAMRSNPEDLKILLEKFGKYIFNENSDKSGDEIEKIWLEILQVLQGICLFLKKFRSNGKNGRLVALISTEIKNKSCCVGEFFVFGEEQFDTEIKCFCQHVFPLINEIQRDYFATVLNHIVKADEETGKSLGYALQSQAFANDIIKLLENKVFNFDSLAGVIRLSETIRPFSVHEGKQQNITFIIGYPYLLNDRLKYKSKFTNETKSEKDDQETEKIEWHVPSGEKIKSIEEIEENEALHLAKSRIMGNSLILQEKGVALFVDCTKENPTCNYIVEPDQRVIPGLSHKTNFVDIMKDIDDVFIVKVAGQRRIEIFYKGKKILVWSNIFATWEEESNWDESSLAEFIKNKLFVNKEIIRNTSEEETVKTVVETIYQIFQTPGEGASFVICKNNLVNRDTMCPKMTITFPELGEGKITDSKNLKNVAIQDGGVLISLSENNFKGRRQWLPHERSPDGVPFWYKNFCIALDKLVKESLNKIKEEGIKVDIFLDLDNPSQKLNLYKICKFKYLLKRENGKEVFWENSLHWPEWYKILSWGTRHMSAMGMSACLWDEAVVVVVSADSTITVFYRGIEAILKYVR